MRCARAGRRHLVFVRNQHDVPTAIRRITVCDKVAERCRRQSRLDRGHLQTGKRAEHSGLWRDPGNTRLYLRI